MMKSNFHTHEPKDKILELGAMRITPKLTQIQTLASPCTGNVLPREGVFQETNNYD